MAAETRGTDYRRLLPALRRIAGEQGVRGLYKGLGATLVQVGGEGRDSEGRGVRGGDKGREEARGKVG